MSRGAPFSNITKVSLILGLLSVLGPMSIDMYLPVLSAISDVLNTPIGSVQGTLTAYLAGMGSAQLFYGPLSDQLGRNAPPSFCPALRCEQAAEQTA